jgi:hypothetical protein
MAILVVREENATAAQALQQMKLQEAPAPAK